LVSGTTVQDFMNFVLSPEFPLGDKVSDLQRKVEALATQFLGSLFITFYQNLYEQVAKTSILSTLTPLIKSSI